MNNIYNGSSRKIPTSPSNPGGWSNSRPGSYRNHNRPKWSFPDYCEVKISSKEAEINYKGRNSQKHVEQLLPAHKEILSNTFFYTMCGMVISEAVRRAWPFCKVIFKGVSSELKKKKDKSANEEEERKIELAPSVTFEEIINDDSVMIVEDISLLGEILTAGDTMMLYSSDGVGKSLGSMQICIDLANGWKSTLLPKSEDYPIPPKHQVFSYDLENKKKDLKKRYKDAGMRVPQNLHIIKTVFKTVSDFLADVEKRVMESTSDSIVNVDNICSQFGTLSPTQSWDLAYGLNKIKEKFLKEKGHQLTVILVNHSVKSIKGDSAPNYAGSAVLARHCDLRVFLSPTRFGNNIIMMNVEKNRNHDNNDQMVYLLHRIKEPYLHFEFLGKAWKFDVKPNKNTKSGDITIYEPSDNFDFTTLKIPPTLNLRFADTYNQQEPEEFMVPEEPKISDKERFIQRRRDGVGRLFSTGISDQEIADKLSKELGKAVSKDDVRNDRRNLNLKRQ